MEAHVERVSLDDQPQLPSIDQFLENPAESAENWLSSLSLLDGFFQLFPQADIRLAFEQLMLFVARLQVVDLNAPCSVAEAKCMNRLLEGIRGVGKTSVTQAICRFVDAMRQHHGSQFRVVSFYFNCKDRNSQPKRPRDQLIQLLDDSRYIPGFSKQTFDSISGVVNAATRRGIQLFLVFDELQHMYVPSSDESYESKWLFVKDICDLGKECYFVATIITGSSVWIRRYAFHDVDGLGASAQFAESYPDLDNTVYFLLRLSPLREQEAFAATVSAVHGNLSYESIARMFYFSGGVGRHMHSLESSPTVVADTYILSTHISLHVILFLLLANELLQVTADDSFAVNQDRIGSLQANPWSMTTVFIDEVCDLIKGDVATPWDVLCALFDEGVLYMDEAGVTFLYPCQAVALANSAVTLLNANNALVTRFVHLLLSSGCQGFETLGHFAQHDILHHVASRRLLYQEVLMLSDQRLSFASCGATLNEQPISHLRELPMLTIFDFSEDKGSDGVWLEASDNGTYAMHLLQIKTGGKNKLLHAGKNPEVRRDTLASIKYRLIRAFLVAREKLQEHGVGGCLKLGSLTLLTTERVDVEQKERFAQLEGASVEEYRFAKCFLIDDEPSPALTIYNDPRLLLPETHDVFYTAY